jgi:hypothetical protein
MPKYLRTRPLSETERAYLRDTFPQDNYGVFTIAGLAGWPHGEIRGVHSRPYLGEHTGEGGRGGHVLSMRTHEQYLETQRRGIGVAQRWHPSWENRI